MRHSMQALQDADKVKIKVVFLAVALPPAPGSTAAFSTWLDEMDLLL